MSGMNVAHSHLKTKRRWYPNIQRVRALVDGEVKRVKSRLKKNLQSSCRYDNIFLLFECV